MGDGILNILGIGECGGLLVANSVSIFLRKIGLHFVIENFTTFFTARKTFVTRNSLSELPRAQGVLIEVGVVDGTPKTPKRVLLAHRRHIHGLCKPLHMSSLCGVSCCDFFW